MGDLSSGWWERAVIQSRAASKILNHCYNGANVRISTFSSPGTWRRVALLSH